MKYTQSTLVKSEPRLYVFSAKRALNTSPGFENNYLPIGSPISSEPQERWFYFRLNPNVFIIMVAMKFRYAMVCSSNQNRSMEAHFLLKRQGFDVSSYGTGAHVKLPGPSLREPNVYEFGTPYKHMFDDLRRKDPELYPPSLHSSSSSLPPL